MSSITIDYDKLSTISNNASSAASQMGEYINSLTTEVTAKYSEITEGSTSKTRNSEYYVNQKIAQLKVKSENYSAFATAVSTFSSNAQDIDSDVAQKIKASKDQFVDKHDYISTNWWTDIKNWFIDLKNSCPLFDAIGQLIEETITGLKNLWEDMKYWYKCGGGKEKIGFALAIIGAVAAVVIAVCSFPASGIVAICAAVGACLAAVNAGVNVYTSYEAMQAKNNGDPAWAKIYGAQDTAQDVLRQKDFHDGTKNRLSYLGAEVIDVLQTVCDVVAIYDGVQKAKNTFKEIKISAQKGKVSFGTRLKQYLFNSDHYTSTSTNPVGWRDILQKRGDLRTLREYGVTKARTIKAYTESLTKWQTFAKKATNYAKSGRSFANSAQKLYDYTFGGSHSIETTFKNLWSDIKGSFRTTDAIDKIYNFKKNIISMGSDINPLAVD